MIFTEQVTKYVEDRTSHKSCI